MTHTHTHTHISIHLADPIDETFGPRALGLANKGKAICYVPTSTSTYYFYKALNYGQLAPFHFKRVVRQGELCLGMRNVSGLDTVG